MKRRFAAARVLALSLKLGTALICGAPSAALAAATSGGSERIVVVVKESAPPPPIALIRAHARRLDQSNAGTRYEIDAAALDTFRAVAQFETVTVEGAQAVAAATSTLPISGALFLLNVWVPAPGKSLPALMSTKLASDGSVARKAPATGETGFERAEPGMIAYRLEDDGGAILHAGNVLDPRFIRGEIADDQGRLFQRRDGWISGAMLTVAIPDVGASLLRLRVIEPGADGKMAPRDLVVGGLR
jgi:hypothetical protein